MTSSPSHHSPTAPSHTHAPTDVHGALSDYIISVNHTLREELLASPYLTYMIAKKEGRALLDHLNTLERQAFLTRALAREPRRRQEKLNEAVDAIRDELARMQTSLAMEHCPPLIELVDALYLTMEERDRRTLDIFIETLLDLRNTWSHALNVVSRAPV